EDVLAQMLLRISQRLHDGGARCVASAAGPREALEALLRFHVSFALSQPELITVHGRELGCVPEPARRRVRRLQRLYVEEWVGVLAELSPGAPPARLRTAVHAAIGLLNSTPYTAGTDGATDLGADAMAALLTDMARAALLAAGPGRPAPALARPHARQKSNMSPKLT
ncbi:MAG: hypothetical protein J2P28_25750, partial [Actinobacteria bacterium]|nr:hypothetical protein [Actinomycetota bacterium]